MNSECLGCKYLIPKVTDNHGNAIARCSSPHQCDIRDGNKPAGYTSPEAHMADIEKRLSRLERMNGILQHGGGRHDERERFR